MSVYNHALDTNDNPYRHQIRCLHYTRKLPIFSKKVSAVALRIFEKPLMFSVSCVKINMQMANGQKIFITERNL